MITQFLDMGSGLTSDDPKLQALISVDSGTRGSRRAFPSDGMIRRRYQAQGNDFTERNHLCLSKKRYLREPNTHWARHGI
ncbi:hypothetical protein BJY01DRAFT_100733 [Aspergillus pseudoustus]|uniref:Uncharacterized protein n=1 Tax=Aspergillus pseudoustus TaxID=1810923 RepID=A0ABR4KJY4_9EURO